MAFKYDKKKNSLVYLEGDWLALTMNLFRAYARVFGGEIQHYEDSKKFFLKELESRAWFKKLPEDSKQKFVLYILRDYAKGFSNE